MRKSIPTCDCQTNDFIQTKTIYSNEYETEVCIHCEHSPVYRLESSLRPEDVNWREQFSQDLHDLLATWDTGEQGDSYFIEKQARRRA